MNSRWMKLGILVLSLLVCIPGLALAQAGGSGGGNGNGNGGGGGISTFTMNNPQPVLIYTVWGGTVAGDNASTLVVYNNGLAIWSQSDAGSLTSGGNGGSGGTGNNVQVIQITNTQINDLMFQLRQAGVFRQRANNGNPESSDTPLTTVTVFTRPGGATGNSRGNVTSLAQTFSFYETTGNGNTGASRTRINDVFTNFFNTNFNGGNGS